jgi:uncharacterized membrane protein YkvA (DUF1232 family)
MPSPIKFVYNGYRQLIKNPKYRWWVVAATLVYLLDPFDISPDFVPLIGQIDDAVVVTMLVAEVSQVLRQQIKAKQAPELSTVDAQTLALEKG